MAKLVENTLDQRSQRDERVKKTGKRRDIKSSSCVQPVHIFMAVHLNGLWSISSFFLASLAHPADGFLCLGPLIQGS